MYHRINRTVVVIGLALAMLGSPGSLRADIFFGIRDQINEFAAGQDWGAVTAGAVLAFFVRNDIRTELKNRGCRCVVKNGEGNEAPVVHASEADVPKDPLIFFWGDSRIHFISQWFPEIMPGYAGKVENRARGGSTSGDFRWYFDLCGGGQYDMFYPNTDQYNHLQLENKYSAILTGGNDFEQYEAGLRALPWLIPLRHGAVLNNMNRLVSYHQAQNSQVIMMSQLPIPAYDGSVGAPWLAGFIQGTLTGLSSLAPDQTHFNFVLDRRHFTTAELTRLEGFSTTTVAKQFVKYTQGDFGRPWLSMQLGHLTMLTVPFVVAQRRTAFANLWFNFKDPRARYEAWWSGNPDLYEDPVHLNRFGADVLGGLMEQHFNQYGFNHNPMTQNPDRCNYTGNPTFSSGQPGIWTAEPDPLPEANDDALLLLLLCFGLGACG